MAPLHSESGGPPARKRSNEARDDPDGKRLKTSSSGESKFSLRGGSGSPPPGVLGSPTDEEWEGLLATGVMTGVGDLSGPLPSSSPGPSSSGMPSLIEISEPALRGNDRGSTFRGSQVDPIPINLPTSTPVKSTASPANSTSTPANKVSRPRSSNTTQPTSTRPTTQVASTPANASPGQAHPFSDDFDASTPFPAGVRNANPYTVRGSTESFSDLDEHLACRYAASSSLLSYSEWRNAQARPADSPQPQQPQDVSGASTSPAGAAAGTCAGAGGGGGDPGDDGSDSDRDDENAGGGGNNRGPPSTHPRRFRDSSPRSSPGGRRRYSDFTTDQEILQKWKALEILVEQYVEEVIAEEMPEDVDSIANSLFEIFRYFVGNKDRQLADSDQARRNADDYLTNDMCQNATYSPYLFQITIWNFLLSALFSRGNHHWAVDLDKEIQPATLGQGCGLGIATDAATNQVIFSQQRQRTYENCMEFFIFRKQTCNYIYEYLVDNANYADHFDELCQELIYLFAGYFKPEYSGDTDEPWTELLRLTTDVVSAAWNLAILIRRSDGVWDPFIVPPNRPVYKDCVELHQQEDLAVPSGQDGILATSKITMTVVPGLVKHEVVRDRSQGPDGCRVRTMRKVCAKVFADLAPSDLWLGNEEAG